MFQRRTSAAAELLIRSIDRLIDLASVTSARQPATSFGVVPTGTDQAVKARPDRDLQRRVSSQRSDEFANARDGIELDPIEMGFRARIHRIGGA